MRDISESWKCDMCGAWHDDKDDARECCYPTITQGWRCETCGNHYLSEEDAVACCKHTYTCLACQEKHETIEQAEECCGICLTRATPKELEVAGQARLLP